MTRRNLPAALKDGSGAEDKKRDPEATPPMLRHFVHEGRKEAPFNTLERKKPAADNLLAFVGAWTEK